MVDKVLRFYFLLVTDYHFAQVRIRDYTGFTDYTADDLSIDIATTHYQTIFN